MTDAPTPLTQAEWLASAGQSTDLFRRRSEWNGFDAAVEAVEQDRARRGLPIQYVGPWGRDATTTSDLNLGIGRHPWRRWRWLDRIVWDFAFGYVSGFTLPAIAYYLATRDLGPAVWHRAWAREGRGFGACRITMDGDQLTTPCRRCARTGEYAYRRPTPHAPR